MKGFTLLEITITLAILIIMVSIVIFSFSGLRENKVLDTAIEETIGAIKEARSKTLSSKDSSQYGVHFEASRIVLFKGTVFTEPNSDNIETVFDNLVEMSTISLNGGGSNVVFQRLTGETSEFGTITLRLKNDITKTRSIVINATGVINVE